MNGCPFASLLTSDRSQPVVQAVWPPCRCWHGLGKHRAVPGCGAIITETIFNYPGMGRLFIDALGRDDWPIVMALLFISAILVVIATLIGDILYTVVDPRIRFE